MYESHFGFSGSPFQLNPDPAFYFDSKGHRNALAYLKFGAHQGEGFIVVTGEIGAGKTTLVRTLLAGLDPNKVVAAQVVSTQLESGELLQAILMSFGIASASTSKAHLIGSLEAFLTSLAARGRRALLIIDEAQNLRHEAVEELRMLSNFQLGNHGLLQSFLVGQPELRQLLQSKTMEQLRQRVIASCHLGPLAATETRAYIEHRLGRVGWSGRPAFADEAFEHIHQATGGVPRKINRLCNRLLLGAFLNGEELLAVEQVDRTADELKSEIGEMMEVPEMRGRAAAGGGDSTAREGRAMPLPQAGGIAAPSDSPPRADRPSPRVPFDSPDLAERRAKFKLVADVPPAADNSPADAQVTPDAKLAESGSTLAQGQVVSAPDAKNGQTSGRVDVQALLSVVPGQERREAGGETKASSSHASPVARAEPTLTEAHATRVDNGPSDGATSAPQRAAITASDEEPVVVRRVFRQHQVRHPILCLTESVTDVLKAGTLNVAFGACPDLSRLVAVHVQGAASIDIDDTSAAALPMPESAYCFERLEADFARRVPSAIRLFDGVIDELQPVAVLAMGSSDAVLGCCLLARKRGLPLFRIAGGQRKAPADQGVDLNGALIDKLCDAIYLNRMDSYYTLYREGIKSERVLCVGSLVGDMLKASVPLALEPAAALKACRVDTRAAALTSGSYALVSIRLDASWSGVIADRLTDLLCNMAEVRPVVWPLDARGQSSLRDAGLAARLEGAGVVLCDMPDYLAQLGLLRGSCCLIAGPEGHLHEEALSLRLPAARLQIGSQEQPLNALIGALDGAGEETVEPAEATRRVLQDGAAARHEAPAYWDANAAQRIANHLRNALPVRPVVPRPVSTVDR